MQQKIHHIMEKYQHLLPHFQIRLFHISDGMIVFNKFIEHIGDQKEMLIHILDINVVNVLLQYYQQISHLIHQILKEVV